MNAVLDWTHETRAIPEAGLDVTREADEKMRAVFAEALGIDGCKRLMARYCSTTSCRERGSMNDG